MEKSMMSVEELAEEAQKAGEASVRRMEEAVEARTKVREGAGAVNSAKLNLIYLQEREKSARNAETIARDRATEAVEAWAQAAMG